MESQELMQILKQHGFEENKLDTGCNYTHSSGHIELICYIETGVEVQFVSIYRWKNNDVKGTHNISIAGLKLDKESVATLFRKTKANMPQYIGVTIDTHVELEKAIDDIFG